MQKLKTYYSQLISLRIWSNKTFLFSLWTLLGIIAAITKLKPSRCNNFLIFDGVFRHASEQLSLYAEYANEYSDVNHYGPFFSLIIAPFSLMPHWAGMICWCAGLAIFCWYAIHYSTLNWKQQVFVYLFCAHELLTALFMQQFNVAIAAILLLSFYFVEKGKDHWATLLMLIGTFVKLYGIVGLAFFFFSHQKRKFILSFIGWSVVLLLLPMCFFGIDYILGQYTEWFNCLVYKNGVNIDGDGLGIRESGTNISLLGIVRRITLDTSYSDLCLIIPGLLLFASPYLRFKQYKNLAFRQMFLASVLMFVCLFSTGTESSSYIIAMTGCVIWYACVPWKRNGWDLALMWFLFILTSLSPSDLFPAFIRKEWVQPFALKALPVVIIWGKLSYEMLTQDYSTKYELTNERNEQ